MQSDPARRLTVFKIGGSLFDLPELPDLIRRVLEQRPDSAVVLIPGGGAAADVVRAWDRIHHLGDEAAHKLALEAMDLATSLLGQFFPEARLVRSERQIAQAAAEGAICLLCAGCFIKAAQAPGHPLLERSWRVTSDSIAAWTARVLGADLVLVKSAPLPEGIDFEEAGRRGMVDECFPALARRLSSVAWVNGRAPNAEIVPWPGERPA